MNSSALHRILAACLILLFLGPLSAPQASLIHLKTGDLDVPGAANPPADARLRAAEPAPNAKAYWIIHWDQKISETLQDKARAEGAQLFDYLPEHAFLAAMTPEEAQRIRALAGVDYVGLFHPAYALSPELGTRNWQDPERAADPRWRLVVELFADAEIEKVAALAGDLGAEILGSYASGPRLVLALDPARIIDLARLPGIQWIEDLPEITDRNNNVVGIVQSGTIGVTPLWDHGIKGQDQVLGHIDSGMQATSCYFADPEGDPVGPDHRKIVYKAGGSTSHGTHTAGTAVGDQEPINGSTDYNGVAPKAKMATSTYSGIDLYDRFVLHHGYGARVHTNSWGDDGTTAYTVYCRDIDRYSYEYEDGMVAFAVTNLSNLKTPENAKNVLAVGATNNPDMNQHATGGQGPTDDGRRKPEIYAPGCNNRSASTSGCGTVTMCGTSMACPGVCGAGLLAREYFTEGWYPSGMATPADAFTPTGALIRAALLNSTFDMTGVAGYPSNREGWGWFALDNGLFFGGDARKTWLADVRNAEGLATGQDVSYPLTVDSSAEPLKITLVFTDPPAAVNSAYPIINDLDLEVTGPSGIYKGNVFVSGESATGGGFDVLNTVERVLVTVPAPGAWTIRVIGSDVPQGPQGYAVVAGGDLRAQNTAAPDTPPAASIRLEANVPNPFNPKTTLRFSMDAAGPAVLAIYDLAGRCVTTLVDGPLSAGVHSHVWEGKDDAGAPVSSGIYFARLSALGELQVRKMTLLK